MSSLGNIQEVFVSVLTKKQPIGDNLRDQAMYAARQVAPLAGKTLPTAQLAAQQAAPLARNAGVAMRQGADTAVAWATPRVDAARAWAAPQIEQSAHAISEQLAPMISGALISAAHRIDAKPRKARRMRGRMVAGALVLTAAAGAAAAVVLKRRLDADGYSASVTETEFEAADGSDQADAATYDADEGPDPDVNGHPRIV
jgi:hypothetical protein